MAYNNAIPQASDKPSASQPQILANFAAIKTLIDIDHVTFDVAGQGKHNKISMPVQTATPAIVAGENCIYNKAYATTAKNTSYIRNQTFSGNSDIPFTASNLSTGNPVDGADGWTYLPSGILLKWILLTAVAGGSQTFDIAASIPSSPAFTKIFAVFPVPVYGPTDQNFSVALGDIVDNHTVDLFFSGRTTTAATPGSAYCLFIGC